MDFFANLSLGHSDDEDDADDAPDIVREGVSTFVPLLSPSEPPRLEDVPSTDPPAPPAAGEHTGAPTQPHTTSGKGKRKNKRKGKGKQSAREHVGPAVPGKWGDKCMYAELLEMNEEFNSMKGDGIPDDIESGWVAVAPVPVGKRCLAITHASSGIAGIGERISSFRWRIVLTSSASAEHDFKVAITWETFDEAFPFRTTPSYCVGLHTRRQLATKRDSAHPRYYQVERSGYRRL